jgi:hypothetical protein
LPRRNIEESAEANPIDPQSFKDKEKFPIPHGWGSSSGVAGVQESEAGSVANIRI